MTPGVVLSDSGKTTPGVIARLFPASFLLLLTAAAVGMPIWYYAQADEAQTPSAQSAAGPPSAFDGSRAFEHLRQMVAIGPRPAGSAAIRQTRAYITRQLSSLGLTVEEQAFTAQTPLGPVEMVNLIVTLAGRRPDRMLVTGHYDTKLMRESALRRRERRRVERGVADRAGARAQRSAARVHLRARLVRRRRSRLSDWTSADRRPDNTYGSRYYVQAAKKAKALASIKAMILVDMIGDKDLQIRRERNSTGWLNDIDLGGGQANRPRQARSSSSTPTSKTTTCPSSRRACQPSTSSTSTTRVAHARRRPRSRLGARASRSSATSCSRRSPTSRSASSDKSEKDLRGWVALGERCTCATSTVRRCRAR